MRTPRRRALRKRGRRADAPYQGASAALSVATLAFARALGRHEQACRHTARGNFSGVRRVLLVQTKPGRKS
jgi:hypothetical protein